jgi:hypothetical protein
VWPTNVQQSGAGRAGLFAASLSSFYDGKKTSKGRNDYQAAEGMPITGYVCFWYVLRAIHGWMPTLDKAATVQKTRVAHQKSEVHSENKDDDDVELDEDDYALFEEFGKRVEFLAALRNEELDGASDKQYHSNAAKNGYDACDNIVIL